MVEWDVLTAAMPLVATANGQFGAATDLHEWIMNNRETIRQGLDSHGAILFRGFNVGSVQQFRKIAAVFCQQLSDYVGGNSPRTKVTSHVFTSTEYPKDAEISMHNEASYLRRMPSTILFYCELPAKEGGETPLADCRQIYKRIDPEVLARFERSGILYVNNMHGGMGLGRSWMDVYGSKDRVAVEQSLVQEGYEYHWKNSGGLKTFLRAPATLRHPRTMEHVWINQAEQWHPSSLNSGTRDQLLSILGEDDLPHNAFLGDGSSLFDRDLDHIRQIMAAEKSIFRWERQDVLLCDNYMVMHGRRPYSGDRRILVAMG